jgi:hypothetical protein
LKNDVKRLGAPPDREAEGLRERSEYGVQSGPREMLLVWTGTSRSSSHRYIRIVTVKYDDAT